MLKIIDRPTIQHSYVVRTSRLTRDGRSAIQVSRDCYYDRQIVENPVNATKFATTIFGYGVAPVVRKAPGPAHHSANNASTLATAPHVPPVKGGPNSIMRTASEPIEMVN